MIAIIGLGNIGGNYEKTYHNIGFMAVTQFAKSQGLNFNKTKYNALIAEGEINGEKVILVKPKTYMNLSGVCAKKVLKSLNISPQNMLVVYDDVDLPVAAIRLRKSGSGGTHNGMRSIIREIGTNDFPRLRIGIGKDDKMDLADYVLSRVSPHHKEALNPTFLQAEKIMLALIDNGCDTEKVNLC